MSPCDECPLRLYNTKQHNLQGVGNPFAKRCIIVPNVDYVAYKNRSMDYSSQVEIIKSIISSTGELTELYILPLIRCNTTISCEVNDDIYNRCLTYLINDFKQYNFRDILLLGEAARRFLNCDISLYLNHIMVSPNNRLYGVNYSPLIKFIDDNNFEIFKNHLLKWYNASINNNFNEYEILHL